MQKGWGRMPGVDLGIDLGTSQIVIYASGAGIVLREPTVIAVDRDDGHMIACGREAYEMLGRTPDSILAVRPIRKGVISDYDYAERMLKHFIRRVCAYKILKPRAAVCIPASVTEVEQRSVVDAATASGIRRVVLIEEAVAAALGAQLDISAARGSMVVDIGAGTTDVAVLSLKGMATSISAKVGGDDMDEAIVRYMRSAHNFVIGDLQAENIKRTIGCACTPRENTVIKARGRDAVTGLPRFHEVSSAQIHEAISEPLESIIAVIQKVLETTPPELAGDVMEQGIALTGGIAQLRDMDRLIEEKTGVRCYIPDDPESCAAKGTGKAMRYVGKMLSGIYDVGQFTYPLAESVEE